MRLDPASDSGEGVKWKDEVQNLNTFPGIPGTINLDVQYLCLGMSDTSLSFFALGMGGTNGFQRTTSTKSLHLLGSHQAAAADWGGGQGSAMPPGMWSGGNGPLGYPLAAQGAFPPLLPGPCRYTDFTFAHLL